MNDPLKQLLSENAALIGSRKPVIERMIGVPRPVGRAVSDAASKTSQDSQLYAIVGEVDKANANRRAYTSEEWISNLTRVSKDSAGNMLGASDHLGCGQGGNLKETAVIWKDFTVLSDGRVQGQFIFADTAAGRDLKGIADGGGKLGFSTYGYAEGRKPTAAEREKYDMPPEEKDADGDPIDDGYVVIQNWELIKIDAVDNPAVRKAWLQRGESIEGENTVKTVDDLKTAGAAILSENKLQIVADDAIAVAVDAANAAKDSEVEALKTQVQDLEAFKADAATKIAKYDGLLKKLGESLKCLGEEHGVPVFREVTEAEAQAKIDLMATEAATLKAQLAEAVAAAEAEKAAADVAKVEAVDAVKAQLAIVTAEKADSDRVAAATSKLAELTVTHKHAAPLAKAFADAVKVKDFTADSVEAFVAAKGAEYDLVGTTAAENELLGLLGTSHVEDEPVKDEDELDINAFADSLR